MIYAYHDYDANGGELIMEMSPESVMQIGPYGKSINLKFNREQSVPHESVITSDFEPQVTMTEKGWEIRFLPSDL